MQPADCLLARRASLPHVEAARAQRLGRGWDSWTFLTDNGLACRFAKSDDAAAAFDVLLTAYGAGATSAFRERVALYARLAPITDALERMTSGDEVTARALVATWADATQSSTLSLSSPQ